MEQTLVDPCKSIPILIGELISDFLKMVLAPIKTSRMNFFMDFED